MVGILANIPMVSPRVPVTVPSTSQALNPLIFPTTVSVPRFQMKTQKQRGTGDLCKARTTKRG